MQRKQFSMETSVNSIICIGVYVSVAVGFGHCDNINTLAVLFSNQKKVHFCFLNFRYATRMVERVDNTCK